MLAPAVHMFSMASLTESRLGWNLARAIVGLLALIGIVLTVMGVLEHLRYRRLERRLAALKGRV